MKSKIKLPKLRKSLFQVLRRRILPSGSTSQTSPSSGFRPEPPFREPHILHVPSKSLKFSSSSHTQIQKNVRILSLKKVLTLPEEFPKIAPIRKGTEKIVEFFYVPVPSTTLTFPHEVPTPTTVFLI